tara:strand:+ start:270 stop:461 length:192 start_codon:yes stop_codon:yes gene_type:complete
MDLLRRAASAVLGIIPGVLGMARTRMRGMWQEVRDGHHRLDWWLLLGASWLSGVAAHSWWLIR